MGASVTKHESIKRFYTTFLTSTAKKSIIPKFFLRSSSQKVLLLCSKDAENVILNHFPYPSIMSLYVIHHFYMGRESLRQCFFIASLRVLVNTDCWKDLLSHDSVLFTVNHPQEPSAELHTLWWLWFTPSALHGLTGRHRNWEETPATAQSVRCARLLPLSEVGNASSLGVLGDCLSVTATQHRPKDVLDKIDELWDEGREGSAAARIRHAIILVLNDMAAISRTVAAN